MSDHMPCTSPPHLEECNRSASYRKIHSSEAMLTLSGISSEEFKEIQNCRSLLSLKPDEATGIKLEDSGSLKSSLAKRKFASNGTTNCNDADCLTPSAIKCSTEYTYAPFHS
eukprot:gnl/TRDRNA2_/TRDRNA2_174368_c0_seq13.p1 gnl/TRDRNA2_/TRDRNA2_174368_c0~~gnl/TRDRNA2_/TRDRNA2_174368_c0_seq13.p1  ORF type:complete len:112 (-),score=7.12 gnl/TRDRNA2_/TRDRNA2_174368_c0_seq13:213-548(-)